MATFVHGSRNSTHKCMYSYKQVQVTVTDKARAANVSNCWKGERGLKLFLWASKATPPKALKMPRAPVGIMWPKKKKHHTAEEVELISS